MEESFRRLEEHLECAICTEEVQCPKFLNCLHSFCEGCLNELISSEKAKGYQSHGGIMSIPCPICRVLTNLTTGNAEELKSNLLANRLKETLKDIKQQQSSRDTCDKHRDYERTVVCEECDRVICSECAIESHLGHSHALKSVEDVFKKRVADIKQLLEKEITWRENVSSYEERMVEIKSKGNEVCRLLTDEVMGAYDEVIIHFFEAREKLVNFIESRKFFFNRQMDQLIGDAAQTRSVAAETALLATDTLARDSNEKEVINFFENWSRRMKDALSYQVPPDSGATRELQFLLSLCFEKGCIPKLSNLELGTIHATKTTFARGL